MAQIAIVLDSKTQECVLTVDGVIVHPKNVYFSKRYETDGDTYVEFSYSVETKSEDGLIETKLYYMPMPPMTENSGLACRVVKDKESVLKDITKYITKK